MAYDITLPKMVDKKLLYEIAKHFIKSANFDINQSKEIEIRINPYEVEGKLDAIVKLTNGHFYPIIK